MAYKLSVMSPFCQLPCMLVSFCYLVDRFLTFFFPWLLQWLAGGRHILSAQYAVLSTGVLRRSEEMSEALRGYSLHRLDASS